MANDVDVYLLFTPVLPAEIEDELRYMTDVWFLALPFSRLYCKLILYTACPQVA